MGVGGDLGPDRYGYRRFDGGDYGLHKPWVRPYLHPVPFRMGAGEIQFHGACPEILHPRTELGEVLGPRSVDGPYDLPLRYGDLHLLFEQLYAGVREPHGVDIPTSDLHEAGVVMARIGLQPDGLGHGRTCSGFQYAYEGIPCLIHDPGCYHPRSVQGDASDSGLQGYHDRSDAVLRY